MIVKIPKIIKIVARNYTVSLDDSLLRDEGNRGCVHWHKQTITLASNMHDEQKAVSFLHECLHVIEEHTTGRANLSEEVICGLAEGVYQLLKENLGIEFDWSNIKCV